MRFTVDGYEIEIKAKDIGSERFNRRDALHFMNKLVIWMTESSEYTRGAYGLINPDEETRALFARCGKRHLEEAHKVHNQLAAHGLYDDCQRR